jgi:hypothetical protein
MANKVDALGWENWERLWFFVGDQSVFYNGSNGTVRDRMSIAERFTALPEVFHGGIDAFGFENWERLWIFKGDQYCFYNARSQEIREVRAIRDQFPGVLD